MHNAATATPPWIKDVVSINPRSAHTAARIAIATDIANIVDATLAICSLFPTLRILTKKATKIANAAANTAPFHISPILSFDASLQTATISMREKDTLRIRLLTFASFLSFPIVNVLTKKATKIANAAANAAPFRISPILSFDASLQTPTISTREKDMLRSKFPTLAICLSFPIVSASVKKRTNITNPAANAAPLIIAPTLSFDTSLQTATISIIATDSFVIILPILPTSPLCLDIRPNTAIKAIIPTTMAVSLPKPFEAAVSSIPPRSFTDAATKSIAKPI